MTTEFDAASKLCQGEVPRKTVVAERWKLLRDALRGKPVNRKATFAGYDMIPSRRLQQGQELTKELRKNLLLLNSASCEGTTDDLRARLVDMLETSLLSLLALDTKLDSKGSQAANYELSIPTLQEFNIKAVDLAFISDELCRRCELDTCRVARDDSIDEQPPKLRVEITTCNKNRFLIRRYDWQHDDSESYLLVRERSPEQVISLAELTSHHRDHEIDNTGNVCVWDCEKTLLWALLSSSNQTYGRAIELGAGMAGLVALGLAAAKRASHVIVTDGNPGSLQSNRTHVRLMEALKPLECIIDPQLLPWALGVTEESNGFRELQSNPADISVVSDCTHFERYHGHLLWTLIQCTAVGGHIWMCHPDRGRTLERFLDVVRLFVGDAAEEMGLLSLQEISFPELVEKHQQLTQNDMHYRPNVHQPRIFSLCKLREASEKDRSRIIHHMATRVL